MNWTYVCLMWPHDNSATHSTGAEVAGSANISAIYYRYRHTVMGTHYFYII